MSDAFSANGAADHLPKPPRRKPSLRAKVVLFLGALLFALVVCEVALRVLGIPADELTFLPKDGSVDWDCYCSNYRGYFVPKKMSNGQTIYCVEHANEPPRERSLEEAQKKGDYTVLTIGDSFTYGLGVKVVDNWPYRLGGLLRRTSNKSIAVSNVAKVGRHVMEILEGQYVPQTATMVPDLCVYGYCLNDPLWIPAAGADRSNPLAPVKKDAAMETADIDDFINVRTANLKQLRIESPLAGLRKRLRTVDVTLRAMETREIQQRTLQFYLDLYDPAKNARGLDITWNAIQRMSEQQKARGKRFLVAIFPMFIDTDGRYPLQRCHEAVMAAMTARGVDVVDLLPAYRGTPAKDLWVHPLDRHPNDLAHRLAAEAIAERCRGSN